MKRGRQEDEDGIVKDKDRRKEERKGGREGRMEREGGMQKVIEGRRNVVDVEG